MSLRISDFVILKEEIDGVKVNSVGLIKSLSQNQAIVFFIGSQREISTDIEQISFLDVSKTGKPHKYKICNVCHILKEDFADFQINQTDAKGRKTTRPSCRDCRTEIDGATLTNSEKIKLDAIKPQHFFVCPICEKGSIPGVTANLVRDHDHETGKARDWLCDSCNTGLGRFKDNIELMEKAIAYLKYHANL